MSALRDLAAVVGLEALSLPWSRRPRPVSPFTAHVLPQRWHTCEDHGFAGFVNDDRSAHMWTESVSSYVHQHGYDGTEIHPDDQWATPEAITRAAQDAIEQCDKYIEMYSEPPYDEDGFGEREIAKHQAQRARYEALIARFGADGSAA
jgi:hypothetical protein